MASASIRTLADFLARVGNVPLNRIRFHPPPGTATIQDVIRVEEHEDRLCELVEGVLLEKTRYGPCWSTPRQAGRRLLALITSSMVVMCCPVSPCP